MQSEYKKGQRRGSAHQLGSSGEKSPGATEEEPFSELHREQAQRRTLVTLGRWCLQLLGDKKTENMKSP